MSRGSWLRAASALAAGILFGFGLLLSGMTQPQKVISFLDWFGAWDPSLLLVMLGAITVHRLALRQIRGRAAPLLASTWAVPGRKDIDFRLLAGAGVFGAGWGLGGYCPGPALVSLGGGTLEVFTFVVSMLAGLLLAARFERRAERSGTDWGTAGSETA